MLSIAIPVGTECSTPGCTVTYQGDPELFIGERWSLMPIDRFAFCPSHSGTPDVLAALRAAADNDDLNIQTERPCANCGDHCLILSSRDWCDGCEEGL